MPTISEEELASLRKSAAEITTIKSQILAYQKETELKGRLSKIDNRREELKKKIEESAARYREAKTNMDTDDELAAHNEMTAAQIKLEQYNNARNVMLNDAEAERKRMESAPSAEEALKDQRLLSWRQNNPWFENNAELKAEMLGLEAQLKAEKNFIPHSEGFFNELDRRMKSRHPELYPSSGGTGETSDKGPPMLASKADKTVIPAETWAAAQKMKIKDKDKFMEYFKKCIDFGEIEGTSEAAHG